MEHSLTCEEVEAPLFELRRGELTDLRSTMVGKHLRNCPACREMAAKTEQMFDAATGEDPSIWADVDADLLFERIEESIAEEGDDVDEKRRLDEAFDLAGDVDIADPDDIDSEAIFTGVTSRSSGEEEPSDSPAVGARTVWIAIAAAACAAIVGWWLYSAQDTPSPTEETADFADQIADSTTAETETVRQLPALHRVSSPRESLRVFADDAATYEFLITDGADEVEMSTGTMLVEVQPESTKKLSVHAQSHTIAVTGTVFTVETGDRAPRVAVFEGSVDVTNPGGQTFRLHAGEYFDGGERGRIDDADYSHISRYVDLDEHRERRHAATHRAIRAGESDLRAAFNAATSEADGASVAPPPIAEDRRFDEPDPVESEPPVEGDEPPVEGDEPPVEDDEPPAENDEPAVEDDEPTVEEETFDEPTTPSPTILYEEALTALDAGHPQRATEHLEEALELTDPSERTRADILLELARIHLHALDDPQRAADYLDRFVNKWPDDPAADAIRNQLCDLGVDETDCP